MVESDIGKDEVQVQFPDLTVSPCRTLAYATSHLYHGVGFQPLCSKFQEDMNTCVKVHEYYPKVSP